MANINFSFIINLDKDLFHIFKPVECLNPYWYCEDIDKKVPFDIKDIRINESYLFHNVESISTNKHTFNALQSDGILFYKKCKVSIEPVNFNGRFKVNLVFDENMDFMKLLKHFLQNIPVQKLLNFGLKNQGYWFINSRQIKNELRKEIALGLKEKLNLNLIENLLN